MAIGVMSSNLANAFSPHLLDLPSLNSSEYTCIFERERERVLFAFVNDGDNSRGGDENLTGKESGGAVAVLSNSVLSIFYVGYTLSSIF